AGVQYLLNGQPLGAEVTTAPFPLIWDTRTSGNGSYVLTARARDMGGNTTTSVGVPFTIANATDPVAPTVQISVPANLASVPALVILNAVATDNLGVAGVQFKLNGANLGPEDTTDPFRVAWDTTGVADGPYNLVAVARDSSGNTTTSGAVQVTVDH